MSTENSRAPEDGPVPDDPRVTLPEWCRRPTRCEVTTGHHLRPLRAGDHSLPGVPSWLDLGGALDRAAARTGFTYLVVDDLEGRAIGVVEVAPSTGRYDVAAGWWVGPEVTGVATALPSLVASWLVEEWPFRRPVVQALTAGG